MMTYTYEDAARALRMILTGLLLLVACLAHAVCTVIWSILLEIIHHPLQTLMVAGACAAVIAFVPTLVALSWLII